jgi:hypothetical protein
MMMPLEVCSVQIEEEGRRVFDSEDRELDVCTFNH